MTRKSGHIINVSSAGVQMGTPLFAAYLASKAALDAFTRVLASEIGDDRLQFTTIHMPLVRTPMIAPTREYRDAPALSPEQAADVALRAVVTGERQLGTRVAQLVNIGHTIAPELVERTFGQLHRQTSCTARRSGSEAGREVREKAA